MISAVSELCGEDLLAGQRNCLEKPSLQSSASERRHFTHCRVFWRRKRAHLRYRPVLNNWGRPETRACFGTIP